MCVMDGDFKHPEFVPLGESVNTQLPEEAASSCLAAMAQFDLVHTSLLDQIADFATDISGDKDQQIQKNLPEVVEALENVINEVFKTEGELEDKISEVGNLLLEIDSVRIQLLRNLLPSHKNEFKYLARSQKQKKKYLASLRQTYDDYEDSSMFATTLSEEFEEMLRNEVGQFQYLCTSKANPASKQSEPSASSEHDIPVADTQASQPLIASPEVHTTAEKEGRQDYRVVKLVGKHALDVAKISAAVAIGIWLTGRQPRRG